jgi:hypothetical protein
MNDVKVIAVVTRTEHDATGVNYSVLLRTNEVDVDNLDADLSVVAFTGRVDYAFAGGRGYLQGASGSFVSVETAQKGVAKVAIEMIGQPVRDVKVAVGRFGPPGKAA